MRIASLMLVGLVGLVACEGVPNQTARKTGRADAARVQHQIVVDFADGTTQADIDALEGQWGVDLTFNSIVGASDGIAIATFPGDDAATTALLARIAASDGVQSAERGFSYSATAYTPNDPDYTMQWHFQSVGAEAAWDYARGHGVVVAVIDTGVAHADFGDWKLGLDLVDTGFVDGYDFVNDRAEAIDDQGHGTHVAGTIAETTDNALGPAGLAFGATIMPLKVLGADGSGSSADIADAIRWAADHGAQVINMSLGGGGYSQVMADAVMYAREHGVVVVCAAGNTSYGEVEFPAAYQGAIAVSATRFDDQLAFYSSYGKELDLAAPGGDLEVDQNGDGKPDGVYQNTIDPREPGATRYAFFQGTSMASPHVAAVAALIMSTGVTDPDRVEEILLETARKPAGIDGWTDRYGYGIVDAAAAARRARLDLGLGRLAALAGVIGLLWIGRRSGAKLGPGFGLGALVTGTGLFFLPFIAAMFPGQQVLATPLMDWGLFVVGASGHANIVSWSAALPLVLGGIFYSVPRLRPTVGGIAAGATAFLVHALVARPAADIKWMPGGLLETLWLAVNAAIALGISWAMTREKA